MITPGYVRAMADYNRWQNENLYGAAHGLGEAARKAPRGAFFGSIHATLNHLLWADQIWMSRLTGTPRPKAANIPQSLIMHEAWDELRRERATFDQVILDWAEQLTPAGLEGDVSWHSGVTGRDMTKPKWLIVTHIFNHQTHHRGQVHCLLTQAGVTPGITDLAFRA
ncbi:MAG TPA: DinB family protein [Hyphomicrobiaceae bacterium]|nr:DinB family protein [Hyphomicrobiaceae bacterium]